jgi:hypothetical protein
MSSDAFHAQSKYELWLENVRRNDAKLYAELKSKLDERVKTPSSIKSNVSGVTLESAAAGREVPSISLETIVREGRPALLVQDKKIEFTGAAADTASKVMIDRLKAAAPKIEHLMHLVGRIDVANYPGNMPYAGTGWLVDRNIIVTNRHVAELISRANDGQFVFRPGRFGEQLRVSVDYLRESGRSTTDTVQVKRVIWIEQDPTK